MTKDEAAIRWLKREVERIWAMLGGQLASQADFHANFGIEEIDLVGDLSQTKFRFPDDRAPGPTDHVSYFRRGLLMKTGSDYTGSGTDGSINLESAPLLGPIRALWVKTSTERVYEGQQPLALPRRDRQEDDELRRRR